MGFEASKAQPQQLLAGMMEALWGDNFKSPCGNKYLRRAIPGEGQEELGHDDCPLYDEGGNHDCAGIHELAHQIPQCMPVKDTQKKGGKSAAKGKSTKRKRRSKRKRGKKSK